MFPTEPAPERIGAYKILRRLAGSGSASVYLGRLEGPMGFQRVCALKLVPNTAEGDPRFAEELAREASICAQLNHPAIVRMFDFFEHEDKLVLVLEHVEGANLDRLLQHLVTRQQKLGDVAVYYLTHRIAGALAHAHAAADDQGNPAPVIHRNLHPENIVLGWDGQVRLTGFGIGKIVGRTPDTIAGVVKGAPGYMAPEQARGERVTTKADVYGMGLLLWSLLANRRPPADGTRPPGIATIRHDLPRPIAALIDASLAPVAEERKITCQEIEQTLGKVAKPDKGKAELVLKIQSAHATIEIEDADREEERRPTIPVKGKNAPTARPGETTKRLAKALLLKDLGAGVALGDKDLESPDGVPTPNVGGAAAGAARETASPAAGDPSEAITIPVPASSAVPLDPKDPAWKPKLPDRETFGRLFEAAKRAPTESPPDPAIETPPVSDDLLDDDPDPVTAQFVAPGLARATGSQPDAAEVGDAASPAAPYLAAIPRHPMPSPIEFGPPPVAISAAAPVELGVLPGPVSGVSHVELGHAPASMPGASSIAFGPPPTVVGDGMAGFAVPGGGMGPQSAGALAMQAAQTSPAETSSVRVRSPSIFRQRPRSLSTAGTIAVSAITATVVAIVWIYLARRDRLEPAAEADTEATAALEQGATSLPRSPEQAAPRPAPAKPPPPKATAPEPAAAPAPAPASKPREQAKKAPDDEPALSALAPGTGYFTVSFAQPAKVYLTGRYVGEANKLLQVRCGRWWVRLAKLEDRSIPEWVTAGTTVHVACQGSTRVDMKPSPPPKPVKRATKR